MSPFPNPTPPKHQNNIWSGMAAKSPHPSARHCSTAPGPSCASFSSLSALVPDQDEQQQQQQHDDDEWAEENNSHPIGIGQMTTSTLVLPVGRTPAMGQTQREEQKQQWNQQRPDGKANVPIIPSTSSQPQQQQQQQSKHLLINSPANASSNSPDSISTNGPYFISAASSSALFPSPSSLLVPGPLPPPHLPPSHQQQCSSASAASPLSTAGSVGSILSAATVDEANNNDNNGGSSSSNSSRSGASQKSRIFPSTRFVIALLLCLCFVSLSISTSNISVSMVCMIKKTKQQPDVAEATTIVPMPPSSGGKANSDSDQQQRLFALQGSTRERRQSGGGEGTTTTTTEMAPPQKLVYQRECDEQRVRKHIADNNNGNGNGTRQRRMLVIVESCQEADKLAWSSTDQGIVFAAQNAGSLLMLFTGAHADRLNSKWTITGALALLVLGNALLPWVAGTSVWLVVGARVLTGLSDALLQPSTSSLITRWFPPKERPFAIGLITGGRQIGTLMILPLAGFLCQQHGIAGGWPAIFHVSALIGAFILFIWLLMAADKPSKHFCTSSRERCFVEEKIAEERLGKRTERRKIPWHRLARCRPLYVCVAALICHEYPLVIMLQLLPKYINDVLHLSTLQNGIVSALPIAVLFIAKTVSATASSYIQARKKGRFLIGRSPLAKWFNGVASLGLGICVGIVPLLNANKQLAQAIAVLCLANAFAGLHTPGVQTALLQIAPAYTGIITGIAFGCVAIVSIANKILSNFIVQSGSLHEWTIVFWISAVIALLPVVFFTLWGSADRQPWASFSIRSQQSGVLSRKCSQIVVIKRGKVFPTDSMPKSGKKRSMAKKKTSTVTTMTTVNGGGDNGNGIFVVLDAGGENNNSQMKRNDQFGGFAAPADEQIPNVDDCPVEEEDEDGLDEEEEEEEDNTSFHPEAAVAYALRLQMFLEHPEAHADEEENGGSNNAWAQCLQAQAWQVGQIARKVSNTEEEEATNAKQQLY